MTAQQDVAPQLPVPERTKAVESSATWRRRDRVALGLCWVAGISLCLIAAGILLYMLFRGLQYLRPEMLFESPSSDLDQSKSGGFLDPIIGSFILTAMGIAIALPVGVAIAVWLTEYSRPSWLARAVESGIEIIAGTPSIVLALFGLVLFSQDIFGFLSFTAEGGGVFGRSFFAASAMMSLVALPLVFSATREGLQSIPAHVREASYALGKTKIATIRCVLLPAARARIATGATLGMGRIVGDTAIVVFLLGGVILQPVGDVPILGSLRGTGSTLTNYVYNNSPAGEGNSPDKAYAAAFVLLLVVIFLNFAVDYIAKKREVPKWTH